jgi:hypothetical protein
MKDQMSTGKKEKQKIKQTMLAKILKETLFQIVKYQKTQTSTH